MHALTALKDLLFLAGLPDSCFYAVQGTKEVGVRRLPVVAARHLVGRQN